MMSKLNESASVIAVRRALLSVSDKGGLVELGQFLASRGVELIASGGTGRLLSEHGIPVIEVSAHTGQEEILGGRVKTLHPKIHGGILARRDLPADLETLERHGIPPIDLVVVNLYPFEATIQRPGVSRTDAIEQIDIGGPALIRAAAKNHAHVAVLTDPTQYSELRREIETHGGTTPAFRSHLALAAFDATSRYDAAISAYLEASLASEGEPKPFPPLFLPRFRQLQELRYGENPHQRAAFYADIPASVEPDLANSKVLHGKELSYNNLLDLDSALRLIRLFDEPFACILKHNNPCGAAVAQEPATAFELAYEGDPVSAYGGIVGLNRTVTLEAAQRMSQPGRFIEAILAPAFDPEARDWLTTNPSWRHSVRLVELGQPIGPSSAPPRGYDLRRVEGGLLVQSWDEVDPNPTLGTVVTQRPPTPDELKNLAFAWKVCSQVKSNAIVLARQLQVVGVGAGQMSRLDSVRLALAKAGERARGAVLASDAFFPFRDGPDAAGAAGVTAIVQPGGSKRDDETQASCNEHGIAMIHTGRRHFRH